VTSIPHRVPGEDDGDHVGEVRDVHGSTASLELRERVVLVVAHSSSEPPLDWSCGWCRGATTDAEGRYQLSEEAPDQVAIRGPDI